jgi:multiple sugar transport system permease protein
MSTLTEAPPLASPHREAKGRGAPRRRRRRFPIAPWVFIGPSLILLVIFAFIPLVSTGWLSLTDSNVVSGPGGFVGGQNYSRMISDPLFWTSLRNTGVFTLGTVPTSIAIGLALAVLLNRRLPGVGLIRSLYFVPFVVSGVAVSLVMAWIFNGDYGIVNNVLKSIGLPAIPFLNNANWAMVVLILAVLWGRIGFCLVIYLAALQAVPASLVEAAAVDGANAWQRFWFIVWPLLRNTTFLLVVLNVVHSLQAFDIIYVLTGGGPGFSTMVFIEYIFNTAFQGGHTGYASAMGVVFILILLAFTYWRYRSQRREELSR